MSEYYNYSRSRACHTPSIWWPHATFSVSRNNGHTPHSKQMMTQVDNIWWPYATLQADNIWWPYATLQLQADDDGHMPHCKQMMMATCHTPSNDDGYMPHSKQMMKAICHTQSREQWLLCHMPSRWWPYATPQADDGHIYIYATPQAENNGHMPHPKQRTLASSLWLISLPVHNRELLWLWDNESNTKEVNFQIMFKICFLFA